MAALFLYSPLVEGNGFQHEAGMTQVCHTPLSLMLRATSTSLRASRVVGRLIILDHPQMFYVEHLEPLRLLRGRLPFRGGGRRLLASLFKGTAVGVQDFEPLPAFSFRRFKRTLNSAIHEKNFAKTAVPRFFSLKLMYNKNSNIHGVEMALWVE
jgi:hypothetical protein